MQTPLRSDGRPFGIAGRVCFRCYDQLRYRQRASAGRTPRRGIDRETVEQLRAGLDGLRRIVDWVVEDEGKRRFERAAWWRREATRLIDAMERELPATAPREAAV